MCAWESGSLLPCMCTWEPGSLCKWGLGKGGTCVHGLQLESRPAGLVRAAYVCGTGTK